MDPLPSYSERYTTFLRTASYLSPDELTNLCLVFKIYCDKPNFYHDLIHERYSVRIRDATKEDYSLLYHAVETPNIPTTGKLLLLRKKGEKNFWRHLIARVWHVDIPDANLNTFYYYRNFHDIPPIDDIITALSQEDTFPGPEIRQNYDTFSRIFTETLNYLRDTELSAEERGDPLRDFNRGMDHFKTRTREGVYYILVRDIVIAIFYTFPKYTSNVTLNTVLSILNVRMSLVESNFGGHASGKFVTDILRDKS